MKFLVNIALTISLVFSASVFAHSGAHGSIDNSKALSVAQTAAKSLTFRAMPTQIEGQAKTIAKIDKSWSAVPAENFTVASEHHGTYTVKAVNETLNETLYFHVNGEGLLVAVSPQS
ncbi:DUF6488 family protein [Thalassotalea sp. PLHSN55]|uniref:DUF6488 family protein n=1 Tax=Thalassotalea sp. PLHSN55 TaxID=3435888 RepID=UPI003F8314A8